MWELNMHKVKKELKKAGDKALAAGKRTEQFIKTEVVNPITNISSIASAREFAMQMQARRQALLEYVRPTLHAEELNTLLPNAVSRLRTKLQQVDDNVARLNDMVHNQETGIVRMRNASQAEVQTCFEAICAQQVVCEKYIQEAYDEFPVLFNSTLATIKRVREIATSAQYRSDQIARAVADECIAWSALPSTVDFADTETNTLAPLISALSTVNEHNATLQQQACQGYAEVQAIDTAGGKAVALHVNANSVEYSMIRLQANFEKNLFDLQSLINVKQAERNLPLATIVPPEEIPAIVTAAERLSIM